MVKPPDEVNLPSDASASASNVNGHPSSDVISVCYCDLTLQFNVN